MAMIYFDYYNTELHFSCRFLEWYYIKPNLAKKFKPILGRSETIYLAKLFLSSHDLPKFGMELVLILEHQHSQENRLLWPAC